MVDPKIDLLAKQIRRALEIFAEQLTDESTMMEIADIYPAYQVGHEYKIGKVFSWGVNADNETQLYQVLQDHVSREEWKPDEAVSLYKKIGITPGGYPIWTQPYGATDAYQKGDIVQHKDSLWISTCDNNVWEPGVYGWDAYKK
jgi:hypothetical protein